MRYLNDSLISLQFILEDKCSEAKKVILVDENTKKHCLPILLDNVPILNNASVIEIASGETNKNHFIVDYVIRCLINMNADKSTVLISLGGGVITDLGGFVAAIYYRGIRHIEVPTTTIAMVDASIGGKNGINFENLKNQIGTITKPYFTCCYLPFLKTLDKRNIRNGAAEMIKIALVADKALWDKMKTKTPLEIGKNEDFMVKCIEMKEAIVDKDFYDLENRQILNFGHNFGHAIESYCLSINFDILHGEAIARGIYYETILSHNILGFSSVEYETILNYVRENFPIKYTVNMYLQLLDYLQFDKKNKLGNLCFTLLKDVGEAITGVVVPETEIIKILLSLRSNN
ncbi:MAG: 3-dehydroquinate synthase [Bacteroidales bacterium]|jgi:3-dehydroquinate synthase|nr:3-dehydroquinate synthase [Bacteroidales bacterium]